MNCKIKGDNKETHHMFLVPNGTKDAMNIGTKKLISNLPEYPLKPFSSNHGKNSAGCPDLEASGIDLYSTHANSSWQRGHKENSNGFKANE